MKRSLLLRYGKANGCDASQPGIVRALKSAGATVVEMQGVGFGCPDLLVGYRSATYLLEVKSEGGDLRRSQVEWLAKWKGGPVRVVYTPQEALAAIGALAGAPVT